MVKRCRHGSQVRFDQHMLLAALGEAPATMLRLPAARQHSSPAALLGCAAALVAPPAAAVWLAERLARQQFAAAQRRGQPGMAAPRLPPDAFFCPPQLEAGDSAAVLAKMADAAASPFQESPRLLL